MLVLTTQDSKKAEPEWVNVKVNGENFRITAHHDPKRKNKVLIIFDIKKENKNIEIIRESAKRIKNENS